MGPNEFVRLLAAPRAAKPSAAVTAPVFRRSFLAVYDISSPEVFETLESDLKEIMAKGQREGIEKILAAVETMLCRDSSLLRRPVFYFHPAFRAVGLSRVMRDTAERLKNENNPPSGWDTPAALAAFFVRKAKDWPRLARNDSLVSEVPEVGCESFAAAFKSIDSVAGFVRTEALLFELRRSAALPSADVERLEDVAEEAIDFRGACEILGLVTPDPLEEPDEFDKADELDQPEKESSQPPQDQILPPNSPTFLWQLTPAQRKEAAKARLSPAEFARIFGRPPAPPRITVPRPFDLADPRPLHPSRVAFLADIAAVHQAAAAADEAELYVRPIAVPPPLPPAPSELKALTDQTAARRREFRAKTAEFTKAAAARRAAASNLIDQTYPAFKARPAPPATSPGACVEYPRLHSQDFIPARGAENGQARRGKGQPQQIDQGRFEEYRRKKATREIELATAPAHQIDPQATFQPDINPKFGRDFSAHFGLLHAKEEQKLLARIAENREAKEKKYHVPPFRSSFEQRKPRKVKQLTVEESFPAGVALNYPHRVIHTAPQKQTKVQPKASHQNNQNLFNDFNQNHTQVQINIQDHYDFPPYGSRNAIDPPKKLAKTLLERNVIVDPDDLFELNFN